jgi:hypothetical protein
MSAMNISPEKRRTQQLCLALMLMAHSTQVAYLVLIDVLWDKPSPLRLMAAWGGFLCFAGLLVPVLIQFLRHQRGIRS